MVEQPRSVREDLAALQIDRTASDEGGRPPWVSAVLLAGLAVAFVAGSWTAYRLTIGSTPVVRIAYAARTGPGAQTRGAVLTGTGYIVTRGRYLSLGVRVPGRIESYLVDEGDAVNQGDPLVRLDPRRYRAALREAEAGLRVGQANLDLRRKELARLQELRRREFSSQAELDLKTHELRVTEAEIERIRAEVARLSLDLQDTVLYAPTKGVILERFREPGEIATPGGYAGSGDLIRMANLEELRAEIDVNEADLSKVRVGQPAEVVPDAFPDRRYAATVVKLDPQINRQKGTLEVEVRILEPDPGLRPDMSVRITFLQEASAEAGADPVVLIPRDAIRRDTRGLYVWVARREQVLRRSVESGGDAPRNRVVVTSGLLGGEAVVIGEVDGLEDGAGVEISEE